MPPRATADPISPGEPTATAAGRADDLPAASEPRAALLAARTRRLMAIGAAALAAVVLAGWATGVSALTSLFLPAPGMKANVAVGGILASAALLVLPARAGWRRLTGLFAVAAIFAIGATTMIEYRLGVDLRVDELLFRDPPGFSSVPGPPGRMSPLAAGNLLLFVLGWFLCRSRAFAPRWVAGFPGKLILSSTLLTLAGYLFGPPSPHNLGSTTYIAPHTSFTFLLLSVGLLASRPDRGMFSLLAADDAGGALVRRLLPAAIAVPLGFAGMRLLGEMFDVRAFHFGLAMLVCAYILVLVWLVGRSGAWVGRYDRSRHRAEAALRTANEELEARVAARTRELRQATTLWRAILDGAEHSIIAVDPVGRVREFNPASERLLGHAAAEVVGTLLHPAIHDPGEVAARAQALSRELGEDVAPGFETLVAKARRGVPDQNEWTYIRKDGSRIPVRLSVTALHGPEGEIFGFLGIASDITALKRGERELIAAKESAERAMRARADFLARMSHEIRTPLNGILGMIDLALQTEPTSEQRDYLVTTQRSAHRLLAIINDILDFSRIDAGKLRLEAIPFALPEAIGEALRPLTTLARRKGIELRLEVGPGTPRGVVGDPHRLIQVVVNLVGNAIKFTERGEVVVQLAARGASDATADVELAVLDTGPGIPADKQQLIFEAFSQVDEATTRTHGGTGLGLAICAELVALMGGRIGVRSEVGQGSRFSVNLPLRLDPQADAAPPEPALERASTDRSTALRLLVAEDDAVNRKVIGGLLEKMGHTVQMVHDGAQALAALSTGSFDLVLMDVEMPEMDGLEATRRLRAAGDATPVVALTAQAMKGDQDRCLAAGMNAYLTKPISRPALMRVLGPFGRAGAGRPDWQALAATEPTLAARAFDREELLQRIEGDRALLVEVVELFSRTGPALLAAARSAVAAGDAVAVERAAHNLVGVLLNLSATAAAEQARLLEAQARQRDLAQAAAGIGGLETALRSLEGSLRAEIRS